MAKEVVSRGCRTWDESLQVLEALRSPRGGEAVAGCTTAGPMSSLVSGEHTQINRSPVSVHGKRDGACWRTERISYLSERQWSGHPPGDKSHPGLSPHTGARRTGWSQVPSAGPEAEGRVPRGDTGALRLSTPMCWDLHCCMAASVSLCHAACLPCLSLGHLRAVRGCWGGKGAQGSPGREAAFLSGYTGFQLALALFSHPGPLLSARG